MTNFCKSGIVILMLILASCHRPHSNDPIEIKNNLLIVHNEKMQLEITQDSKVNLYYNERLIVPSGGIATDYLVCDNDTINSFILDFRKVVTTSVNDEHGKGIKVIITGTESSAQRKIEKLLSFTIYDKYPGTIITTTTYKNTGSNPLAIHKAVYNRYIIDASLTDKAKNPFDFMTFSGASHKWGKNDLDTLQTMYHKQNYMGIDTFTRFGGGIPLVDFWNEKIGIAIAQINPFPELVSFPVRVREDKKVEIWVEMETDTVLRPGNKFTLPKTATFFHILDYYSPLQTYASLLADQGIKKLPHSPRSFDLFWCTWGYGFNFSKEDVLRIIPKLKELGFQWIVIDDRWFDRYGDWQPRKEIFPGGEKDFKYFIKKLHEEGFKVQIWWYPTCVQGTTYPPKEVWWVKWEFVPSMLSQQHPDWFVTWNGKKFIDPRYLWCLCPGAPGVKEFIARTTKRFIRDYDFDGIKIDALYEVPPCDNPVHNHASPEESYQQFPELVKIIAETSKSIKPECVNLICNCGSIQDFFQIVNVDQPETSDPASPYQNRVRIKYLKALCGNDCPVFGDFVEVVGNDFASIIGTGSIPASEFTWPAAGKQRKFFLTPDKEEKWKKWFGIYQLKMLPQGTYLNLYDIVYDKPETHVIRKGDTLFYAFYNENWSGKIELRGLERKSYKVIDYINNKEIGVVDNNHNNLDVKFEKYLLIECIPN